MPKVIITAFHIILIEFALLVCQTCEIKVDGHQFAIVILAPQQEIPGIVTGNCRNVVDLNVV